MECDLQEMPGVSVQQVLVDNNVIKLVFIQKVFLKIFF